LKSSYQTW